MTIRCGEYNVDSMAAGGTKREELRGLTLENCLSPRVDESTLHLVAMVVIPGLPCRGVHTGHVVGHKQVCRNQRDLLTAACHQVGQSQR